MVMDADPNIAEKHSSVALNKFIECDLGALLATDSNPLDAKALRASADSYLLKLTRENTQILFNKIFELPTERVEEAIVVKLPPQIYRLPRAKPVPRPRQPTKWEQFAKAKGIVKKKKSKLTWDDQLKKWIPLYGFKRAEAQRDKSWVLEVPQNANPLEDQFAKQAEMKTERIAKNDLQRMRNIAKAKNVKVPRFGVIPEGSSAKELQTAITLAKSSTASLGKFQDKLPKEKEAKGVSSITPGATRKRKLPPVSVAQEKDNNLTIVDNILKKRPKIDIEKAVSRQINEEQVQRSEEKKERPKKKASSAKGGGRKKPKNTNKMRKGKTAGGHKRR